MRKLEAIKSACSNALNGQPEGNDAFHSMVDPATVLEMATAIESLLTYVEKTDDLTARELAREIVHRFSSDRPEGGV
ncbi:hypothetical protein [Noviherbaspirillum sp.]|uniref:hypothetical protein n=1 Tax=Noviherbaspirillum sp. TaxID=1926288 RepID=UPI002FDF9EEF